MPVDRRLLPVSSAAFVALLVGCGVGAGAPASVATGTPLAPVPTSTPVLTVPPQWADAVCAGYLTITIPVDLQDAADTNDRTNEAIDALEHAPTWPPGDPIVAALLRWNRAVRAAEAQDAAGDHAGAQQALEASLFVDARGAGILLDRLADDAALSDVARVGFPCRSS